MPLFAPDLTYQYLRPRRRRPPLAVRALLETLTEDFSTKNTTLWNYFGSADAVSGRLSIVPHSSYGDGIDCQASVSLDLRGSSMTIEVVQPLNVGNGTTEAFFVARKDATNDVKFFISGTLLGMEETVAGTPSTTTITFNATNHRWLRIDHTNTGSIVWQTSPDGTSWTTVRTKSPGATWTGVFVECLAGFYGTEPTPGTLLVDNLNLPPTGPNADAALTATATITAAPSVDRAAAASLTATATISATATVDRAAAASTTVTTTISAAAAAARSAASAFTVTATVSPAATVDRAATATRTVTATITAAASVDRPAAAATTVTAAISPVASVDRPAAAATTVTAAISPAASIDRAASAAVTTTAAITAVADISGRVDADAARTVAATIAAQAAVARAAAASEATTVAVTAAAAVTRIVQTAATVTATVTAAVTLASESAAPPHPHPAVRVTANLAAPTVQYLPENSVRYLPENRVTARLEA